jgi:hypothetical protein
VTITNVYIGKLSGGPDPLDWSRDPATGVPPPRLGEFFPPARQPLFLTLLRKIKEGVLEGRQIDWGAWGAEVSKLQILQFIEEVYDGDETYLDPTKAPHLFPMLADLVSFVGTLDDNERYALVAIEL